MFLRNCIPLRKPWLNPAFAWHVAWRPNFHDAALKMLGIHQVFLRFLPCLAKIFLANQRTRFNLCLLYGKTLFLILYSSFSNIIQFSKCTSVTLDPILAPGLRLICNVCSVRQIWVRFFAGAQSDESVRSPTVSLLHHRLAVFDIEKQCQPRLSFGYFSFSRKKSRRWGEILFSIFA